MSADSDPNPADSAGDDCEKEGEKEREEGEQGDKEREEDREEKENGEEKENEGGKKSEEEEEESKKQKEEEEKDLFRLVVVNSYGSQEVQRLKDDDSIPLKLGSEWMCVLREEGEGVWGRKERGYGIGGRWIAPFIFAPLLYLQTRRTLLVSGRQT